MSIELDKSLKVHCAVDQEYWGVYISSTEKLTTVPQSTHNRRKVSVIHPSYVLASALLDLDLR